MTDELFPLAGVLTIKPIVDEIVETHGHDIDSDYVERFWLPILGPSSICVLRLIGARFRQTDDPWRVELVQLGKMLGLGARAGKNSPLVRTLTRLGQFHVLDHEQATGLVRCRRALPALSLHQKERLPELLRRVA